MSEFYVRLDEESKTPQQLAQREATYQAAKILRAAGYRVHVQEYFTGHSKIVLVAGILLKMDGEQ